MKKLAIVFAVGAAALMGGSAANAADNSVKAKTSPDVTQSSTDISSRSATDIGAAITTTIATGATVITGRITTATATTPRVHGYYGGPRYYGGGPGVTFSFGSGGYRGW